jgi:GTP diphosphokinase / guanosine-3',5'-bis(diphosphate) 3'-diphosphatase
MVFSEDDVGQLIAAISFSANKHQNQRRKGVTARPYINHPIEVARLLWQVGHVRELPTLVAALLHDVLEDTETSLEELSSQFGPTVMHFVSEVSDNKKLPKAARKRLQIETAAAKTSQAKLIKLADKISNVSELSQSPPADWSQERVLEYYNWAEKVVGQLRGENSALESLFDQQLSKGRNSLLASLSTPS